MSSHAGWLLAAAAIATALGGPVLAGSDQGGIDCIEIAPETTQEYVVLGGGKLLLRQSGRQSPDATFAFEGGTPGIVIVDPSGQIVSAPTALPWPSLRRGELLPDGKPPRTSVGAACGVPAGLTLVVPPRRSRTAA